MPSLEEVTSSIDELLDEVHLVSYQHLSRHLGLPCNSAKQALFDFLQRRPEACSAVYLLSGWTKETPSRHLCSLVPDSRLEAARQGLARVTSSHVYCLTQRAPAPPLPATLAAVDAAQAAQFVFAEPGQSNCVRDNRLSAVARAEGPPARRTGGMGKSGKLIAQQQAQAADAAAAREKEAGRQTAAAAGKPVPQPLGTGPSKATVKSSAMAGMFARAPPAAAKDSPKQPSPKPAAAAEPARGGVRATGRKPAQVIESDDDDDDFQSLPTTATAAAAAAAEAKAKRAREEEEEAQAAPSAKSPKPKPLPPLPAAFAPSPGKAAVGASGKRKQVVTSIDEETGEETTEVIWVDAEGNPCAPPAQEGPRAAQQPAGGQRPAAAAVAAPPPKPKAAAAKPAPAKAAPKGKGANPSLASFFGKK